MRNNKKLYIAEKLKLDNIGKLDIVLMVNIKIELSSPHSIMTDM